ncbi:Shikimate 5-dehydrogenase, partial [gut metagenome]
GVVERPENIRALRQNGTFVFIDRPVSKLKVGGRRPLSTSMQALCRMEKRRRPFYLAAADLQVANNGELFREAMLRTEEELYAYFGVERPKPESSGPA